MKLEKEEGTRATEETVTAERALSDRGESDERQRRERRATEERATSDERQRRERRATEERATEERGDSDGGENGV
jgi:hypothetical protein